MQDPETLTQPARERQHCFIVRVDGHQDDLIQAHRRRLERKRRARVSLAEAARDLFAQALGVKRQKTERQDPRQLAIPGLRVPATGRRGSDGRLTHPDVTCERQSVNCEHCGDPVPPDSRPSRRYCSGSCRVLACRGRKRAG
jgi:hypothetical protein